MQARREELAGPELQMRRRARGFGLGSRPRIPMAPWGAEPLVRRSRLLTNGWLIPGYPFLCRGTSPRVRDLREES